MNTKKTYNDDGMIGLAVLVMMAVAFIAAESHSAKSPAGTASATSPGPRILIEQAAGEAGGAIRELRIVPLSIEEGLNLGWASDEEVLEEYRRSGL